MLKSSNLQVTSFVRSTSSWFIINYYWVQGWWRYLNNNSNNRGFIYICDICELHVIYVEYVYWYIKLLSNTELYILKHTIYLKILYFYSCLLIQYIPFKCYSQFLSHHMRVPEILTVSFSPVCRGKSRRRDVEWELPFEYWTL